MKFNAENLASMLLYGIVGVIVVTGLVSLEVISRTQGHIILGMYGFGLGLMNPLVTEKDDEEA